jgi:hypothetical protein
VEPGVSKVAHSQSLHGCPLGRSSVVVAEQLLNGSDIPAILEDMGSEGVAKSMTGARTGIPAESRAEPPIPATRNAGPERPAVDALK